MSANTHLVGSGTAPPWIEEEVKAFVALLKSEKKAKSTINKYSKSLRDFFIFVGKPVSLLTKEDMTAWKLDLAERYDENNSMIPEIAAVNQYLEVVVDRRDLKVKQVKRVEKDIVCLTEAEVKAILDEARKPRIGVEGYTKDFDFSKRNCAAICVMYYGGLRSDEVASLRISGLDLDRKRLRVTKGKGNDYSNVNITGEAVLAIRDYIENGRPTPIAGSEDYLMMSSGGRRLPRNALWKMVKVTAFRAGIEKNVYPHIFRHSMITHMAEKGLSAPFIQAQSRHKKLGTVQKYIHLSHKSVRDEYDKVFEPPSEQEAMPAPEKPPEKREVVHSEPYPVDLRERILLRYLDGEITDDRLEKLLSLVDQQPKKERKSSGDTIPGYF